MADSRNTEEEVKAGNDVQSQTASALVKEHRIQSNFFSMISHELRTPLHSINGFLEIVTAEQAGPLNELQKEFLGYVRASAQQLIALVEDILLLSRADAGQFILQMENTTAEILVTQATESVRPAAEKAQVRITRYIQDNLPVLRADPIRIQHVLANLLNNAIKFSPPHEEIRVSVRQNSAALEFAIEDHGKGLASEEHQHIFERFYQSTSGQHTQISGYGLGLTIARLIVEQHQGQIWLESSPGEGATFHFTLPLSSAET